MAIEAIEQGIQAEWAEATAALSKAAIELQSAEEKYRLAIAARIRIAEILSHQDNCM